MITKNRIPAYWRGEPTKVELLTKAAHYQKVAEQTIVRLERIQKKCDRALRTAQWVCIGLLAVLFFSVALNFILIGALLR